MGGRSFFDSRRGTLPLNRRPRLVSRRRHERPIRRACFTHGAPAPDHCRASAGRTIAHHSSEHICDPTPMRDTFRHMMCDSDQGI
jgi:hypothetical protein